MLFCSDLPHKLLFLVDFPSHGLKPTYLLPFQSCCPPACHWYLAVQRARVSMSPNSYMKGQGRAAGITWKDWGNLCWVLTLKGTLLVPHILQGFAHQYTFTLLKKTSPKLWDNKWVSGDIQCQRLLTYALCRQLRSSWMLSSTHSLFLTMALSQWDEVQNHALLSQFRNLMQKLLNNTSIYLYINCKYVCIYIKTI